MENNHTERELEKKRLAQTIFLAEEQLRQARRSNEENKEAIISAKREMRENTSHSISNLWSSEGFEALAELSQYANPVADKIADYEETENKISVLENLVKSPYFARIDFKFDGEEGFEKIYIGRSSLKKDKAYEMYVYDWRSPIASVFYRFVTGPVFYDAPAGRITGEVGLKRQYEIKDGVLEYFFDAEVQIVDEFLRQLLSRNTSAQMKTIVETIQREQDVVIRDMENDLMMVQGVAGSGKTSIALHRAAYLMYQGLSGRLAANNILILSPNTLFEQYISNVLPELGENNVVSAVFEDILKAVLKNRKLQSKNDFLENLLMASRYHEVRKGSIEWKTSFRFKAVLDRFLYDLPYRWIGFEDVCFEGKCVVRKEVLRDKVCGRAEIPVGVKLKQLEEFILESAGEVKRARVSRVEEARIRQEIQAFTKIDVLELYRSLLDDREYLYQLMETAQSNEYAENAGSSRCQETEQSSGHTENIRYIEAILDYTEENLDSGYLHYDDAIVLAYLQLRIYGSGEYKDIRQVVIDEAQDYYPLQYEIFHLLFANSKFTVLGDRNQTLGKQENMSLYEQIRKSLNKKRASLITMDKSFRCTSEILNYSLKFIERETEVRSFNRKGEEPEVHVAKGQKALCDMVLAEAGACLERGYASVGLICKTEKSARFLFEALRGRMEVQLIRKESDSDLQGVFIIPVYMSKGLEFDAVLICDADARNYNSEEDRNLLYIACTRALHRLNLFCDGEASPLL